jgi:hypothetical protein
VGESKTRTYTKEMASAGGGAGPAATLFDYVVVVAVQDGSPPPPTYPIDEMKRGGWRCFFKKKRILFALL